MIIFTTTLFMYEDKVVRPLKKRSTSQFTKITHTHTHTHTHIFLVIFSLSLTKHCLTMKPILSLHNCAIIFGGGRWLRRCVHTSFRLVLWR